MYLFVLILAVLCLHCCVNFSLVAESGGYSLFAICRLLIAVASLVEPGLSGTGLSSCGSQALEHRLDNCGTRA